MRRIGGVWEQVVAMDNLYTAYGKARQGKRRRPDVARFSLDLEQNLLTLQRELVAGAYAPGPYRQFTVYERKPRRIAVAPFRDRVVHHAVKGYLRYVDDLYLLDNDKRRLWALRDAIIGKLEALRLVLRADKTQVYRTTERVDVLGYKVSRYRRWLRNDNGFRFRRRLRCMSRLYRAGEMDWPAINASVQSWVGHARHAETGGLRAELFSQVSFNKGAGQGAAGA